MKLKRIFAFLLVISCLASCLIFSTSAADPDFAVLGASMRITGVQGLRFIGKIANNGAVNLTTGESANFGIILIPKSVLADNSVEIGVNTESVKIVPAKNLLIENTVTSAGLAYNSGYYYFSAVLTGIPEEFYGTEIVARAYINNGGNYIYSGQITRSVQYVAAGIAENENAPDDQKEFAENILAIYEEKGIDMLLPFTAFWDPNASFDTSNCLQNTYHKLTVDKQLNVGYIGGSVTVGVGIGSEGNVSMQTRRNTLSWRGLTTNWLRTNFPHAQINEIYAAIGGSGSNFGAFRAIDNLHLKDDSAKPDLLFVDFAVNDQYDGTSANDVKTYMETIVRTVNQYAPYCDIIFVYVTDSTRLAYTDSSHYPTLAAQHEVAQKYGIKEIYVGKLTCEKYNITSSTAWTNSGLFYDTVHPVVAGYAEYGAFVAEVLQAELINKNLNPHLYSQKTLPSASYGALTAPARYFFNGASGKTTFTLTENKSSLDEYGSLSATAAGAKVKFTFKGTGLQLWTYARTEASTIKVTVDGTSTNYTIQRGGSDGNKAYVLATGLSNTTHTVTIESVSVSSTSGKELTLRALMVYGDTAFTGVTFQSVS